MNKLDSELAAGQLEAAGFVPARDEESACLVLLNTCSVRAKAQDKATSVLSDYTQDERARNGHRLVGVMGCVAQQMKERLLTAPYHADFVLGTGNISQLREILERLLAGERGILAYEPECSGWDYDPSTVRRKSLRSAFVAVSRGCSNLCSYCIVPYVRGTIRHREPKSIIEEVKLLTETGCIDVCLLGQNVNAYRYDGVEFVHLLERLAHIDGMRRLRFITTHPKDLCLDTVKMMAHPPFAPYISMPLQSGSDRVLCLMNRGYTKEEYMEKVCWLREHVEGCFISSDIMVGFPGETDADFEDTLQVVRLAQFDNVYSFIYSPRPFTKAAGFGNEVEREVVKARFERLLALQRENNTKRLRPFVRKTVEVLVDGMSRKDRSACCGRSPQNIIVNLPDDRCEIGELVLAEITKAGIHSLVGKVTKRLMPAPAPKP